MDIGYINFSQAERDNIYKVVQTIREHQAIDELGIGRIRDAFSNELFPGISVLQNRAKYFVLLPALYIASERRQYRDAREVRQRILDMEIGLTRQLLMGTPNVEERRGITGRSVIDQAEHSRARYVKYDPSYIYWGGLETFGMVAADINRDALIFERSQKRQELPEKYRNAADSDEESADDAGGTGVVQPFDAGGNGYTFDGKTPISIKLTEKEAAFIKARITQAPGSRSSLLAYILSEELPIVESYMDLGGVWPDLPERYLRPYRLSVRFSHFVLLLRTFYNHVFYKRTGNGERAEACLSNYQAYREQHRAFFTRKMIAEVVGYVDVRVKEASVKRFCEVAAGYVEDNDLEKLESCLVAREKQTKGSVRAKLANAKKFIGEERGPAGGLDYRWPTVYSMIQEIKEGIKDE